jgi:succinyl-CoA synthetase alpha subunit
MPILVDENTRVLVQGITGREGTFHAVRMRAAGTNVVAGTSPGRGGQEVSGVPVFDTVSDAMEQTRPDVSVIFVPAGFARDAMIEAADAGIRLIVCVTEDIPARDMAEVISHLERRNTLLIGPNGPGLVTPRRCNVGIMPADVCMPGSVGLVSRSGTLTYEVLNALTNAGIGQSTVVGMGGDPVHGLGFVDCLERFQADPETEAIVLIGEIGGNDEETAAQFIKKHVTKPVVAFVAGFAAPPGKRMGHAGAIVEGGAGTAADKKKALEAAGIPVAKAPLEVVPLLQKLLEKRKKAKRT